MPQDNELHPQADKYIKVMVQQYKDFSHEFDMETECLECAKTALTLMFEEDYNGMYRAFCRGVAAAEVLSNEAMQ